MPQSIPKGLTRDHILRALSELDSGLQHPFRDPTGFDLVHEGRSYPPKAVVGIAAKGLIGRMLRPDEFSSGVAPGQAVHVLRELGFNVVRMADDWTGQEVTLIVADYFDMLRDELLGQPVNKTVHRRALAPRLNQRSDGSIEFKHQNISAVLVNMGLPYIAGYKPRGNFQALLAESVEEYVQDHQGFFEQLSTSPLIDPQTVPITGKLSLSELIVAPPERIITPHEFRQPWLSRRGRKIDFVLRDAENRRLGKMGEEFVITVEKRRLLEARRDDLAKKVEWVAQTCGDGVGYNVLSFDPVNDAEKYVEVKTTGLPKSFPFLVTANEVRCSEALKEQYHLYRVFEFSRAPKLYMLSGELSRVCRLDPVVFRASI